jgi:hypothetical protein
LFAEYEWFGILDVSSKFQGIVLPRKESAMQTIWSGTDFFRPVDSRFRITVRHGGEEWKVLGAVKTSTLKILLEHPRTCEKKVVSSDQIQVGVQYFSLIEKTAQGRRQVLRNIRPAGDYSRQSSRTMRL